MAKIVYVITTLTINNTTDDVIGVFDDKNKAIACIIETVEENCNLMSDIEEWYCDENEIDLEDVDGMAYDTVDILNWLKQKLEKDIYYLDQYFFEVCAYWLNNEEP